MKLLAKLALAALVSASFFTGAAQAANLKEAKDVRIAFVVHGSASDPYWSVVKRGVDDAAALTGATGRLSRRRRSSTWSSRRA